MDEIFRHLSAVQRAASTAHGTAPESRAALAASTL
jgi:hypothetical protein